VRSATVVAPVSPFGFGGTKDAQGTPNSADFAGSGGGTVSPTFVQHMAARDRGSDNPQASPRVVMNAFYWKPPFKAAREEEFLSSMLAEKTGGDRYPGDFVASQSWPNVAPGKHGPINAISPAYAADTVAKLLAATPKPPVFWVRGAEDQIVADMSLFDFATLGKLGAVPGWPGDEACPPQPMVTQTRAVLQRYAASGGSFRESVYDNCGHAPFIEHPARFNAELAEFLARN
jgi:pimeloyl-ACP methyl ester carboxylesterase